MNSQSLAYRDAPVVEAALGAALLDPGAADASTQGSQAEPGQALLILPSVKRVDHVAAEHAPVRVESHAVLLVKELSEQRRAPGLRGRGRCGCDVGDVVTARGTGQGANQGTHGNQCGSTQPRAVGASQGVDWFRPWSGEHSAPHGTKKTTSTRGSRLVPGTSGPLVPPLVRAQITSCESAPRHKKSRYQSKRLVPTGTATGSRDPDRAEIWFREGVNAPEERNPRNQSQSTPRYQSTSKKHPGTSQSKRADA